MPKISLPAYVSSLEIHSFVLPRCSSKIQITWEMSIRHAFTHRKGRKP